MIFPTNVTLEWKTISEMGQDLSFTNQYSINIDDLSILAT